MMPAIVVPPELFNMKVLSNVNDVLGALVLESKSGYALIDGW